MTQEALYSSNFFMYGPDGLKIQCTVWDAGPGSHERAAAHVSALGSYLAQLQRDGWRVSEPVGDARPKVVAITGWVLGQAEDKRTADFKPCVHLYGQYGDYKQVTVYWEKLGELPFDFTKGKLWDGAAPDRENAQKRGVLNACNFEIYLAPIVDASGNPILTDKEKVKYRFGGVKSAIGQLPPVTNGKTPKQTAPDFTMDDVPEMAPGPAKRTQQVAQQPPDDILVDATVPEWVFAYVERLRGADTGRDATEKQHAFAVRLVDDACGKGNHRAALVALLGREVTAQSPVTEGVFKELLKTSPTTYVGGQPTKNEFYSENDKEALRNVHRWAIGERMSDGMDIPF